MAFNFTSDADKLAFIRAVNPDASAQGVLNNPAQFQRYIQSAQENLSRSTRKVNDAIARIANAQKEVAKGGVNAEGRPLVDLQAVINENKAIIDEWMPGLQKQMERYGQFVDSSMIDTFNSYAEVANEAAGTSYPTLQGGSGQRVVTMESTVQRASGELDRQGEPGATRPQRNAFPTGTEGQRQYTEALNTFLGRQGDPSTEQATYLHVPSGQYVTANVGSNVVLNNPNYQRQEGVDPSLVTGDVSGGTGGLGDQQSAALDFINNSDLPADLKQLYSTVVQGWDPNTELNADNIIKEFNKIRETTIDPYFQGLANLAIESVKTSVKSVETQRGLELEQEALQRGEDVRGTQGALEESGLTFSGEGKRQLGKESAFGGTEGVLAFGGEEVEGLVPQKHRLISTSSQARHEEAIKRLGLGAEEQLGTAGISGLVPGYTGVGSVTGQLPAQQEAELGQTLGTLLEQQRTNLAQNELLEFPRA